MTRGPSTPGREIVQRTEERISTLLSERELMLPSGYAWQNALKSAWLQLQDATLPFGPKKGQRVLDHVTEKSVANALLDMVVQGLNPAAKQGYFIPYGQTLTFQRSYFGSVAVAKRVAGVEDVRALVVYAGDELELEVVDGRRKIVAHRQTFDSIREGTIVGVYAIVDFAARTDPDTGYVRQRAPLVDVMTIEEVRASWQQSRSGGKTHDAFPEEMAKRTVIQRALKPLINTATDDYLFLDAYNRDATVTVEAELEEDLAVEPIDVDLPDLGAEASGESLEEAEEEAEPTETPAETLEEQSDTPQPASESDSAPAEEPEPESEPEGDAVDDALPQQLPF